MEQAIRVAVIGCGWAGIRHTQAYQQCGGEIRWAVDVDTHRAESLSGMLGGIRTTTDYREALDDPVVEAVDICLPHALHAPVAVAAAQAGKHILCEKPMAASLMEADQMMEAAAQGGVVLMIAENVRFNPLFHKIRELSQEGVIGQPALLQMTREAYLVKPFVTERRWFLDKQIAAGGMMMSGGIHDVETMRMLIGEIASVHALRARQRFKEMEGDDTSVALIQFCNGVIGTLVESFIMKSLTTASGSEVYTLRIDGDLGSLTVRDGQTIQLFSEREDFLPGGSLAQHEIYVPRTDTFVRAIAHFLESIQTGQEPLTSGRSQRRPLEIVLAAYQSMETGVPVKLFAPARENG
jgi:predicted dehydrogenase